jgi:alkylated DNA repair dioxygenase AlkB
MDTLFSLERNLPQGFLYQADFLSKEEQNFLLHEISKVPLRTFIFQGFEAKRKVKSFGYDYRFDKRSLTQGEQIPPSFQPLIKKVADFLSIDPAEFAELLLTEYPIGSVINWHRDAPPFELIAGISLGADCSFRLRPYEKERQSRSSIISLPVKRASLYVVLPPIGTLSILA